MRIRKMKRKKCLLDLDYTWRENSDTESIKKTIFKKIFVIFRFLLSLVFL